MPLKDLSPSTDYVYRCGSDAAWSQEFSFHTIPASNASTPANNWAPHLAIFGDMGVENAQALPYLQEDTRLGMYDALLHIGDFAYDMADDNGQVGDEFMRRIEPIAANVPYMVVAGNHEEK